MSVEIELTRKGDIRGDFKITRSSQYSIKKIDVIVFYRFSAFIETMKSLFGFIGS